MNLGNTQGLYLRRLQVQQVRRFDDFVLDDLSPGLNIIAGPNGVGKSTLVRALRAAFLERHKSNSASDLQPEGNSGASPTIVLEFLLHGQLGQLHKTFLKRQRCDLVIGGQSRSAAEAEEWLAQALGFTLPERGSNETHWGVPGLLWLEQGLDPERRTRRIDHAAPYLHQALHAQAPDAATTALAATDGDALLARLESSLRALIGKSGKPVGQYASLLEKIADLAAQQQQMQAAVQQYRQQVDTLSTLLQEQAREAAQPPDRLWQVQLEQARSENARWQQRQQQFLQQQQQLRQIESECQQLAIQLDHHAQRQDEAARRERTRAQAQLACEQAHQQALQAQRDHAQAQKDLAACLQQWQAAQRVQRRRDWEQRQDELKEQLAQLQATHAQAQTHQRQLAQRAEALGELRITQPLMEELRILARQVEEARVRRDAQATRVQFALKQPVLWGSASGKGQWSGEGGQWLDGPTRVQLPDGSRIDILPGAQQGVQAAQQHAEAEQALHQALAQVQCRDLAEAQLQWEQRCQWENECAMLRQLLQSLAPDGVDALESACQLKARQLQQLCSDAPVLEPEDEALVAGQEAQALEQALQQAQARAQEAQAVWQRAEQLHAVAQQQQLTAEQECQALHAVLQDPAKVQAHAALQREALLKQAARSSLAEALQQEREQMEQDQGRLAAQDIQRLEASLLHHAQRVQQRRQRIAELRAGLEAAGAQGLEEALAALGVELAQHQRRADQWRERADTLTWLVQRLSDKRTAALQRLQAPLEQRLRHYVQLLLPGGQVALDASLRPERLVPGDSRQEASAQRVAGAVEALSHGTQEQLAVLSRLAYADLLRDAGQPTLLLLDDALVHTDSERRIQMKRALFDAAQRHQVLLFTCHPELWQDLGVPVRMLDAA